MLSLGALSACGGGGGGGGGPTAAAPAPTWSSRRSSRRWCTKTPTEKPSEKPTRKDPVDPDAQTEFSPITITLKEKLGLLGPQRRAHAIDSGAEGFRDTFSIDDFFDTSGLVDTTLVVAGLPSAGFHGLFLDFNEDKGVLRVGGVADNEPLTSGKAKDLLTLTLTASGVDLQGVQAKPATQLYTIAVGEKNTAPTSNADLDLFEGVAEAPTVPLSEDSALTMSDALDDQFADAEGDRLTYDFSWHGGTERNQKALMAATTISDGTIIVSAAEGALPNVLAETSFSLVVTASDGFEGSATPTKTFTLVITGDNDAPSATETMLALNATDGEALTTTAFDLGDYFTDPDSELSYELGAHNLADTGLTPSISGDMLTITGTPAGIQDDTTGVVTVTATDGTTTIMSTLSFRLISRMTRQRLLKGRCLSWPRSWEARRPPLLTSRIISRTLIAIWSTR